MDALAADFDVLAPDLPGFGASAPLPGDVAPTPRALAEAIAAWLDELEVESAHLVGNSLGGWIALELALMGRARTVTTLCAAGMWSRPLGPRPELPIRSVGRADRAAAGPGDGARLGAAATAQRLRRPSRARAPQGRRPHGRHLHRRAWLRGDQPRDARPTTFAEPPTWTCR